MANGVGPLVRSASTATTSTGPIAYFCAEYGFHESLGIYSGGLGVLAGDHMKTASDMALPLVGVGLMYRKGYFRQTIDADGHQEHAYPDYDLARLPILRALDRLGEPLTVSVELPGRELYAAVWVAQVGRVPVLLLDTDVPDNDDSDRPITHILYVRGREMRLHQELVLGVGGVRALRALGLDPAVWHLNEGHSAFLLAERARELVAGGAAARRRLARRSAATACSRSTRPSPRATSASTPTSSAGSPVPCSTATAGPARAASRSSASWSWAWAWSATARQFDMTAFSLRLTNGANAVSPAPRPHGQRHLAGRRAARDPGPHQRRPHARPGSASPCATRSSATPNADLDAMDDEPAERRFWERIGAGARRRSCGRPTSARSWSSRSSPAAGCATSSPATARRPATLEELEEVLDPGILTIGFARRFATYKRASLLFSDLDRLARILWDADRPVQIIFAGKAHPADRPGQGVIQDIFSRSRSPKLRGRVFIMEDYDIRIARFLVQGVDVWLNNPRRPLEASGTSGMKAAANGVLNMSRARRLVGRGLDRRQRLGHRRARDQPRRGRPGLGRRAGPVPDPRAGAHPAPTTTATSDGLPSRFVQLMRNSIASTIWRFSTTRMLHEYVERLYLPAAGRRPSPRRAARSRSRPEHAAAHGRRRRTAPWPRGSRSRWRSTTTSPSATSAGCSPRSTTAPTCRCSRRSSATRASASRCTTRARCSSGWPPSARSSSRASARWSQRDQVELLGGGLYEPILASLPEHDRIDQLTPHGGDDRGHHRPPAAGRLARRARLGAGPADVAGRRRLPLDHPRRPALPRGRHPRGEPLGRLHHRGPGQPADRLRHRAGPPLPDPVRRRSRTSSTTCATTPPRPASAWA